MTLSVVQGLHGSGNPTASAALNGSVGVGQVVLAWCVGGTLPGAATVADSVNTGNYNVLYSFSGNQMVIYWIITNATGNPTVTISGSGGFVDIFTAGVTGFVGTPTADTLIQATATGSSTTPTIAATSNFNNEIMLVGINDPLTQTVTVSGWSHGVSGGPGNNDAFYSIEATAGTANNFNGSVPSSFSWALMLAGIYDAGGGAAVPAPMYYRKNILYFI